MRGCRDSTPGKGVPVPAVRGHTEWLTEPVFTTIAWAQVTLNIKQESDLVEKGCWQKIVGLDNVWVLGWTQSYNCVIYVSTFMSIGNSVPQKICSWINQLFSELHCEDKCNCWLNNVGSQHFSNAWNYINALCKSRWSGWMCVCTKSIAVTQDPRVYILTVIFF